VRLLPPTTTAAAAAAACAISTAEGVTSPAIAGCGFTPGCSPTGNHVLLDNSSTVYRNETQADFLARTADLSTTRFEIRTEDDGNIILSAARVRERSSVGGAPHALRRDFSGAAPPSAW
jgi:hypothetical protein